MPGVSRSFVVGLLLLLALALERVVIFVAVGLMLVVAALNLLCNIAMVAELIIQCASHRKESRGLHYNIEYPRRNDARWLKDTLLRRPMI